MTPADLRVIRLSCAASLRSAGPLPWLLLLGWIVLAAEQEPLFLRRYGLRLLDQAAWGAATILVGVLWSDAISRCRRPGPRIASALALLGLLAVAQATLTAGAELVARGACDLAVRLAGSVDFFVTWCATAIALASVRPATRRSDLLFVVMQIVGAVAISTNRFRSGWSSVLIAAAACCVLAAILGSDLSLKRTK